MKKTIILAMFAALCTLTAGCADDFKTVLNDKYYEDDTPSREPDITEQTLTLGSYNLWISGKGTGDYLWTNRRTVLAQSIVKNKWDIFGFQEANGTIQNELPTLVGHRLQPRTFRADRQALLLDLAYARRNELRLGRAGLSPHRRLRHGDRQTV